MERCSYAHKWGMAKMSYHSHGGSLSLFLVASVEKIGGEPMTEHLASFLAFPGQIGVGRTPEEAFDSLQDVFEKYLAVYVELNGPQSLQDHLEELGFAVIPGSQEIRRPVDAGRTFSERLINLHIPPAFMLEPERPDHA